MKFAAQLRLYFAFIFIFIVPNVSSWAVDVTSDVTVNRTRPIYDFINLQTVTNVSIENITTETIVTPLQLVVDSITSQEVTVANADGQLSDGRPYFNYDSLLGDGLLDPGEVSLSREIRFNNPNTLRFDFTMVVLGEYQVTTNTPPTANAGADQTAFVTDTIFLDGSGSSDLDGDIITYSWQFTTVPGGSAAVLSDPTAVNPSFIIDLPGTYTVQLMVNDGADNSAPDMVNITTENSPPVANAGSDQTALVGDTVMLDGSGSSDVDGNALSYAWYIISRPTGSTAVLDDAAVVNPSIVIDLPGTYIIQLIINDGLVDSAPDTVVIITENTPPVANAGPDQTALVSETVTLNGGGSSDVDGDPLTFSWSLITLPAGSGAVLSDPGAVTPSFNIDLPGTYVAQLIVNDGFADSAPDTVTIVTENSPPVAIAGPNQSALVGDTVTLDGSASSDVDGDSLTYSWSLITVPSGSASVLFNSDTVNPSFVVDLQGTYVAQLIVNDGTVGSAPNTVTITTDNSPPVSNAGADQTALVGDAVTLDGSGSSDVDGDALMYSWSMASQPVGSTAALSDPTAVNPSFTIDVFGVYVVQLIVNDGTVNSNPDSVTITTDNSTPVADAGPDQTAYVTDVVTLDGSGSSDVDGDPLTFSWSLTSVPAGSAAVVSDNTAVNPTIAIDLPGTYVAQLIVNDGSVDSAPDTVIIVTENSAPVADAGADQSVLVGDTITLDGSGSSDVDGDSLTYSWSFSSVPSGSTASLSDVSAVNPSFTIDLPGTYIIQLIVNDGALDSSPDSVVISTENSTPIADAGPDQTALVGDTVTLDGSGSSDADGDGLTFNWALTSVPSGSTAVLSDTSAVNPSFDIDLPGTYVAQLIVNDGTVDSAADTVMITTENSPPVANAGPDQTVFVGDTVTLDGSNSSDVDGDLLTFTWSFTSLPAGSTAVLSDDTAVMPTFDVDVFGTYVLQLIVNDGTVDSAADTVTIITENSAPVANAGPDQTVLVGDTVTLDGSGSSDVDGDALTYTWSFTSRPAGSTATISDANAESPNFVVDESGIYVLQLIVNDGAVNSAPDTVTITTENSPPVANAGTDQNVLVGDTVTLDGSGSDDVDGDSLTYAWSIISMPSGSTASLSDETVVGPTFDVDVAGTYVIQLIVNDGIVNSDPDSVVVITVNRPPVANAGADIPAIVGQTVNLNGTASSDPDGDILSYAWTLLSVPAGSAATLTGDTSAVPSFIPDLIGVYEVQLVVNDDEFDSAPDTVVVTAGNTAPVANAGPDQTVNVDDTVTLDGSGSSDSDGHSLTYSWTMTSVPAGSSATLSDATAVDPTFDADVSGDYVLELVVNDGYEDSAVSTVIITASQADIILNLIDTALVGVGRFAQVSVTLSSPAPAGGVTVTVTSDNTSVLTVEPPATTFIAEGDTVGQVTVAGLSAGTSILRGNATGYSEGTLDVGVTLNLISVPTTLNVPLGQTVSFPVSIAPDPAPVGGVVINLVSSDPATAQLLSSSVTIPQGAYSANASITGHVVGAVSVNASNPNYAADSGDVAVTAELNIVPASVTFSAGFPVDITIRLQSLGVDVAAPAPISVALTPADPSCVAVPSPVTIATGFVSTTATVSYQGTATLPCNTTVVASAPNITSDSVSVTINPASTITFNVASTTVGSGLQTGAFIRYLNLNASNHGGVTVRIESSNDAVALVGPSDTTTAGTAFYEVFVPDGTQIVYFTVHGVEGVVDSATLTASAPGFIDGTHTVDVVQPALDIINLATTTTTLSADDPFRVRVGIPNATDSFLQEIQPVRAGGGGVTATVTSSLPAVGQLVTTATTGSSVTVDVPAGDYYSAGTVATGGVAFDPLGAGTTSVSAAIPGFVTTTAGTVSVEVISTAITFSGASTTVGSGLQTGAFTRYVNLNTTAHGGVTVRIESSNAAVALVGPSDTTTAGTAFYEVFVPDGTQIVYFTVHGVEGVVDSATLTASAPGFIDGTHTVDVVQPALDIINLATTTTTLSADDPFRVRVGIPNIANTGLMSIQPVRAGGGGVTATVTSSLPVVGQLVTTATTGSSVTVNVPAGDYYSASTVATGGVAFDPLNAGTTSVSAAVPGFITTTAGTVNVEVIATTITFSSASSTVGSGLQTGAFTRYVNLGATAHGGVTLRIESSNAAVVLVGPSDTTTAAVASYEVFVPDGTQIVYFTVHGVEGVVDSATLTASAPGFINGTHAVDIVQPALDLINLATVTTTLSNDDEFRIRVGIPNTTNSTLQDIQPVRAGGGGVTATVTSSLPTVGQLVTTPTTGSSVTVDVPAGSPYSASTVATGGVAFDPLTSGITTVTASIPGFITTTAGTIGVDVIAPEITFSSALTTVGGGLQTGAFTRYVNLGATAHGGVTLRIESSNAAVALVGPSDTTTAAVAAYEVFVPDGTQIVYFTIHGVEGATGTVSLTASAPGFIDGTHSVEVVQPALDITSLSSSTTSTAADDPFRIRVGIPNAANTALQDIQPVRAGASGLTVTVTSSLVSVGQLVTTPLVGASVTVQIPAGAYISASTVATGGVAFDPLAGGGTIVSASIPGFITTANGSVVVTVSEALLVNSEPGEDMVMSDSGGGGAFDPYLFIVGVLYLTMFNRRRRLNK